MPHEWDARGYDALPLPHEQWGLRTLSRLALAGGETVLDVGCGTGRDTAALLDRLPHGRVIAVDGSAAMLDQLQARLAGRTDRLEIVHADLTRPLRLPGPAGLVDAVFSVAAFHWIPDHGALFDNLAAVLAPGGQLVFECGGHGNIANVIRAIDNLVDDVPDVWNFADVAGTDALLRAAGFVDTEVTLVADPAVFPDDDLLLRYLETVVLGAHLDRLPLDERAAFTRAVAERLPAPVVDYVRLTVRAVRGG
ncbi:MULTISPECIES: class I SAM-dependent methyltransferase [Protofrankia]|uniref:Methyltransferase type 11 n=1 Tax=Candidatus Protofrankia datiscae TaxID=2716812 RepID=F8AYX2_9ACTN|nr:MULTISPECIES: class I SAM-dependent methyltransferase [Protofrankia]AEH09560.1 Methyltransferase type 11 [Candidatus Protofrankia datiscae]